ncbi:MAG: phosphoribosylformylglycinamidine synthase II, partial [Alphaproteobacteria bacterium]|nr:phosphoribosylformylglycinamidine synthase II [Alphaproteobacteria bacterium]
LAAERRNGDFIRAAIVHGRVSACHDVSDGGLLVALAEMALAGGRGFDLKADAGRVPLHAWLFGEDQARYVVTAADSAALLQAASAAGVPARVIGRTSAGRDLTLDGRLLISLHDLRVAHEGWLPTYMAQEL